MPEAKAPLTRYTLRLATLGDLDDIVAFFKDEERPSTVFERTREAFQASISNGLFWLLTNPDGSINTVGGTHILSGGMNIGSTVGKSSPEPQAMQLDIRLAEIGSIWRRDEFPSGFCLDLIYSACIMQTLVKAQELFISAVVTQIVAKNTKGAKNLMRLKQGWEEFMLSDACTHEFKNTVVDAESRETELVSFLAPAHVAILSAARCLLGIGTNPKFKQSKTPGILTAYDRKAGQWVEIDVKGTGLLEAAQTCEDRAKRATNLGKHLAGRRGLPWTEAGRHVLETAYPQLLRRQSRPKAPPKPRVSVEEAHVA